MAAQGKQNLAGLILGKIGTVVKKIFTHSRFQIWTFWIAGPVFLLVYGGQLAIILASWWPVELRGEQLKYVGVGSWIMLGLLACSMFFLADVVKRVSLRFGMTEIEVETQDDEEPNYRYREEHYDGPEQYGPPRQHPEDGGRPGRRRDRD